MSRNRGSVLDIPVLGGHALDASADANVNHARLDLVDDVDGGLETRGALAVEGADGSSLGEASDESGGAHFGGATSGSQDSADSDVLNEGGVDLGAFEEGLEGTGHQVGGLGVLEAALATLGEGRAEGRSDDDLRGGRLDRGNTGERWTRGAYIVGILLEDLVLAASGKLAAKLSQSLEGCLGGSRVSMKQGGRLGV